MAHDLSFQHLFSSIDFLKVELQTVKIDPLVEVKNRQKKKKNDSWSKIIPKKANGKQPTESLKEKRFIYLLFVLNFHFISSFSRFFRKLQRFKFRFLAAQSIELQPTQRIGQDGQSV
jgi:hypothetical protein